MEKTKLSCKICGEYRKSKFYAKHPNYCKKHWIEEMFRRKKADPGRWSRIQNNSTMKKRYGVDLHWYEVTLKKQDGRCAICGTYEEDQLRRFSIDHEHSTGIVRGLLCQQCNIGLGAFRESLENLQKAMAYLRKNQT